MVIEHLFYSPSGGSPLSVEVTRNIWAETRAEGAALLVLLALGDYANTDGEAWPRLATLARKTRISERQTRRHLARLLELGELRVIAAPGRGRATRYQVTCGPAPAGNPPTAEKGVVHDTFRLTQRGTSTTQKGDIHDRAYKEVEPSKKHQLERGNVLGKPHVRGGGANTRKKDLGGAVGLERFG